MKEELIRLKDLIGKYRVKRFVGRLKCRRKDNTRKHLRETGRFVC
jgi:hypothetical protein